MYQIERERFGEFIAAQRKAKGWTQKELARRLYVSDKAVSKWERGLSLPDVALLLPISEKLGVTVTELLEGRRIEPQSDMRTEEVETLVKKAMGISPHGAEKTVAEKLKEGKRFLLCAAAGLIALLAEVALDGGAALLDSQAYLLIFLGYFFGVYFWFFIKERLPDYYDENRISCYSDGIFRINLAGVRINNRNWPYIVKAVRIWTAATTATAPLLSVVTALLPGTFLESPVFVLTVYIGGLFLPMIFLARKYQ